MNNTRNLNVWNTFALNHIYKDINSDALKTIEAFMFLSPPSKDVFKESFTFNLDIGLEVANSNRSPVKIQKKTNYNFSDFLVLKLIENFRRVYAIESNFNKQQKATHYRKRGFDLDYSDLIDHEINPTQIGALNDSKKTDLDNLEQQQKNIYSIINKLKDFLFFKDDLTLYSKAVVGKNYEATIFEIGCYLGVHQSLRKENITIHKDFMDYMDSSFSSENINFKNIKLFNKLYYPYDRRSFIQMYLNKFSSSSLIEDYLSFSIDKPSNFYKITLIDLLGDKKDLALSNDQKTELLIDLFRNPFLKYFTKEEKNNFEKKLDSIFSDINYEILFKRHIMSPAKAQTPEYEFVIKRVISFNDEELLLKSLNEGIKSSDRDTLLKLFDLSDQNLLKKVVDILSEKSNGVEKLKEVLSNFSYVSKDSLTYIIAKNANFFPVIQPYYLMEKLAPSLKDKDESGFKNNPKKI